MRDTLELLTGYLLFLRSFFQSFVFFPFVCPSVRLRLQMQFRIAQMQCTKNYTYVILIKPRSSIFKCTPAGTENKKCLSVTSSVDSHYSSPFFSKSKTQLIYVSKYSKQSISFLWYQQESINKHNNNAIGRVLPS